MDLRELVGERYVVSMDESWKAETSKNRMEFLANGEEWWYQEIRGEFGKVYPNNESQIAVSLIPFKAQRLAAVLGPEATVLQRGEDAITLKTDVRNIHKALRFIKAKHKHKPTAEQIAIQISRLAPYRFRKENLPQENGTFPIKSGAIPVTTTSDPLAMHNASLTGDLRRTGSL